MRAPAGLKSWHDEFRDADLGDARRWARLTAIATQVERRPAGRLTTVFEDRAEREGAYRFIESTEFSHEAILTATRIATARRAAAHPYVYVATDQAGIKLADRTGAFGNIGRKDKGAGAQAMTSLVITPSGVTLGLAGQALWTRSPERSPKFCCDPRPVEERETRYWLDVIAATTTVLAEHAPKTTPWFQLDRGADAAHILLHVAARDAKFTVRSAHNRCVHAPSGPRKLHARIAATPALGRYTIPPRAARGGRAQARRIEVRAVAVTLELSTGAKGRPPTSSLDLWAVEAREVDAPPGVTPLLWRLLTNHAAPSFEAARAVIDGYTQRWRVEEFHLAWKSGTCHIEDSQLRSLESFAKWATILAIVAERAQRLKLLSRETPDVPAAVEFTRDEIDAVIILRKPKGVSLGAEPTIGEVVRWIADIGGYTGKSSGGPPGVRVIGRALADVWAAAEAVARMRAARL